MRAVTNRLVLKYYGQEKYKKVKEWDLKKDFIYLTLVDKKLEEYERNRNEYTIFNDFYGNVIDALKCEAKKL